MTGCSKKEETKEPAPNDTTPKEDVVKKPEFSRYVSINRNWYK